MNRIVAIVGPTGIGKSRLAINLAQDLTAEIVSADSRQVYRMMDIGTAKPAPKDLSIVPHHLIDIINPDEDFSLAQYQQLAYKAIDNIQHCSKLPLLVGGSGLYIWSVVEGWGIPRVAPDPKFRHELEMKAATEGGDSLYRQLINMNPSAAQRIDQRNVRRLIRALEVQRQAGVPDSKLNRKNSPPFSTLIIGLTTDRAELYRRIDTRVDTMIEQGLVDEVIKLTNIRFDFNLPALSGIGYKEIGMYLRDEITLATAIQQIKYETHRYVRQQYNWFRLKDDRIHWFDVQERVDTDISNLLADYYKTENI
ncbi:tRNA (adenosine(37)-N6)-dimethylallyltransferase MiaA [Chloroflexota bacterium]